VARGGWLGVRCSSRARTTPLFGSGITRAFLRYLYRRRALAAVQLLGIAVGVASAIGMSLAARTALGSFTQAVQFLQGAATHSLARPAGGVEEELLTRLMHDPAVAAFSPVIDRRVELAGGELVRVLGVDPFLDRRFRPGLAPPQETALEFVLEPRTVLADTAVADRIRAAAPDPVQPVETSHGPLRIVGTFPNPTAQPLFLIDLGHAQELFSTRGRVDRVELVLRDPQGFRERWSEGFVVRSSDQQLATTGELLRSFRLNLQALSLLGLFVGVFLLYNTAMFAVVSRKADAAVLRSLGAERREIAGAFLAEFLLLGGLGGLAGAGLGFGLSRLFTELLGSTISSLYFFLRPSPPAWSWGLAAGGVLLGWGACLLGGAVPLAELVRTNPAAALAGRVPSRGGRARADTVALAGLAVIALSAALLPAGAVHVYSGFAGAFGLLAGAGLVCGSVLERLGPGLRRAGQYAAGMPGRIAAGNITGNLGRSAVAVAAFAVALAVSVALGLMIDSFRRTMVWWMEGQLTGQVYIAPSAEIDIPLDFYEEVRSLGSLGMDPYHNEQILFRDTPVKLTAVSAATLQRYARFAWADGDDASWDAVRQGAVLVSESFWRRFGVGRGDALALPAANGPVRLPVAGVFYDYTTEHGLVMLDRSTYLDLYGDPVIDSLGLFLDPDNPEHPEQLAEVIRRARARNLPVVPREELYGNILGVFDATFAVTRAMRLLAVVVAFCGITGALLTLYLERRREFGIYRALGFSTAQVAGMTLLEGLAMGAVSLLIGVVLGTVLSLVLIRVINVGSFHWTVFFHFAWQPYLTATGIAVAASAGAALYPMWKLVRSYPQMQLREE